MADDDTIDVLIRLRGGRVAAAEARAVGQAVEGVGRSARQAASGTDALASSTRRTGSALSGTLGIAIRYSAAYFALHEATQAFTSGFRFDATMEQNTVAFSHFLGSTQAATAELQTLYGIAAHTPFQFSDVTSAARQMLAFGFSIGEANDELRILGDAVAGLPGGGAGEINRVILAIGQIRAKGKLQADELLQLTSLGLVGQKQLAETMGMTSDEFTKAMERGQISSEEAITAINSVLTSTFSGMAAEQAKTVTGQLSTIKDSASQAMGALVAPLFELARSSVLPFISDHLASAALWLADPNAVKGGGGGAESMLGTLKDITKWVAPLAGLFLAYRSALLLASAAQAIAAGTMWLYNAGATFFAALALAGSVRSLAEAWWLLDAAMAANPIAIIILAIAALIAGLVYAYVKFEWFRDGVNAVFAAIADGVKWSINTIIHGINLFLLGLSKIPRVHVPGLGMVGGGKYEPIPYLANGGMVPMGGAAVVGERGPELLTNQGGTAVVTPMGGGGGGAVRTKQPIIVMVPDGRVLAELVHEEGMTAKARGG